MESVSSYAQDEHVRKSNLPNGTDGAKITDYGAEDTEATIIAPSRIRPQKIAAYFLRSCNEQYPATCKIES